MAHSLCITLWTIPSFSVIYYSERVVGGGEGVVGGGEGVVGEGEGVVGGVRE